MNGIFRRDGPNHSGGIACGERPGGNAAGDNTARADDAAVADSNAGADHHIGTEPAAVADGNGLGIAQMAFHTVAADQTATFVGEHGVQGSMGCRGVTMVTLGPKEQ